MVRVGHAGDEMFDFVAAKWSAVSLAANDIDRAHSGNNIKMTAPGRGIANISPVFLPAQFRTRSDRGPAALQPGSRSRKRRDRPARAPLRPMAEPASTSTARPRRRRQTRRVRPRLQSGGARGLALSRRPPGDRDHSRPARAGDRAPHRRRPVSLPGDGRHLDRRRRGAGQAGRRDRGAGRSSRTVS